MRVVTTAAKWRKKTLQIEGIEKNNLGINIFCPIIFTQKIFLLVIIIIIIYYYSYYTIIIIWVTIFG